MTRCIESGWQGRQCSGKARKGTNYCNKHSPRFEKIGRRCLGATWKGLRCRCYATTGEDYCALHTPFPKTVNMYYIARNLKPYERFPNGTYRKYAYPKLFHTRAAANYWLHDNWKILMMCQPGKRVVSVSVEAVRVKNKGVYVQARQVDRTFPANEH